LQIKPLYWKIIQGKDLGKEKKFQSNKKGKKVIFTIHETVQENTFSFHVIV
jgi:hypothetical protein